MLLCAGNNVAYWAVGRFLQGAASAVVWVVGNALVADTVGADGVGKAVGYTTMACSVGLLAGPLLGGALYEYGGYYAVFGLAFALIGLDFVLRMALIEKKHAERWLASSRSVTDKTLSTRERDMEDNAAGVTTKPPEMDEQIANGGNENSSSRHMLGRVWTLLCSPRALAAIWVSFVISVIISSFDSVLPLFVRDTFHWKQSGQGLIFVQFIVPHAWSPIAGSIIDKNPRACRYITAGALITLVPALSLLRFVRHNTIGHKVLLCGLLTPVGACIAVTMPPLYTEVLKVVEEKGRQNPRMFGQGASVALAFGLTNIGFASGAVVGPFLAGFIREKAGWETMGWVLALLSGVTSLPTLMLMRGWVLA